MSIFATPVQYDEEGYQLITYRLVYVFRLGRIGDSEGRTWAKELKEETRFPSRQLAEKYRSTHPEVFQNEWGTWRTKYSYGRVGIFEVKEPI